MRLLDFSIISLLRPLVPSSYDPRPLLFLTVCISAPTKYPILLPPRLVRQSGSLPIYRLCSPHQLLVQAYWHHVLLGLPSLITIRLLAALRHFERMLTALPRTSSGSGLQPHWKVLATRVVG